MSERVFTVEGMTCDHCVQAVTREVAAVPGVESAAVDLTAKTLTVTGDAPGEVIAAAVEEAGYTMSM
jgi:copper chaperone CopZ